MPPLPPPAPLAVCQPISAATLANQTLAQWVLTQEAVLQYAAASGDDKSA